MTRRIVARFEDGTRIVRQTSVNEECRYTLKNRRGIWLGGLTTHHFCDITIDDFSVDSKHQRKGYGTRLLQHALSLPTHKFSLIVTWDNDVAIALYEKHGFKRTTEHCTRDGLFTMEKFT